jgi:hypothetical protein
MENKGLARQAREALLRGNFTRALDLLTSYLTLYTDVGPKEARDILKWDYESDVNNAAEELTREWKTGYFTNRNHFMDAIEERASSHHRTCNVVESLECAAYSRQFVNCHDEGDLYSQALAAFRQDIIDALKEREIDVDDRPPQEGEILCDTCDTWSEGEGSTCNDCKENDEDEDSEPAEEAG